MDMSFWNKTGDALAPPWTNPPRLDFATLVAGLDRAHERATPPCEIETGNRERTPAQNLVVAVLGRDGWRQAAAALGGCFVPGDC